MCLEKKNISPGLDVLQPCHQLVLVPVRPEPRVLRRVRIQMVQGKDPVVGEDGFHPHPADVVPARGDQHVAHAAPSHVLAVVPFKNKIGKF